MTRWFQTSDVSLCCNRGRKILRPYRYNHVYMIRHNHMIPYFNIIMMLRNITKTCEYNLSDSRIFYLSI